MFDSDFGFEILVRDGLGRGRVGILRTPHGDIETPNFFFCGTKGVVKGLSPGLLIGSGTQGILANTYHLMVQPGVELISQAGGLHRFMSWDKPLMTDSGGFQIFAMGHGTVSGELKRVRRGSWPCSLVEITEDGAIFRSYFDGRKLRLSPETVMDVQHALGSDFMMPLDECTPFHAGRGYTARAMERSLRWGERCILQLSRLPRKRQVLYGIIQGGIYEDLRRESVCGLSEGSYFGFAIGGTLGGEKRQMYEVVEQAVSHIRDQRPVHLLGIGDIPDILTAVRLGVDTFDCVAPTRLARHGWALYFRGLNEYSRINLRNTRYKTHHTSIDERCTCYTCGHFSCAYLHHLLKIKEMLGLQLITLHNVFTMVRVMKEIRRTIYAQQTTHKSPNHNPTDVKS